MRFFKRIRPRFSLRLMLCSFPLIGLGFGWLGHHVSEKRAEQRLVKAIQSSDLYFGPQSVTVQTAGGINLLPFV